MAERHLKTLIIVAILGTVATKQNMAKVKCLIKEDQ